MVSPSRNHNLRILSIAYSNGRLTSGQYTTLRAQQLSAIEFDKAPPPIPPELNNIDVPTLNVDPIFMQNTGSKNNKTVLLVIAGILLLLSMALVVFFVVQHRSQNAPDTPAAETPSVPTLPQTPESTPAASEAVGDANSEHEPTSQDSSPQGNPQLLAEIARSIASQYGTRLDALDAFIREWNHLNGSEQALQRQAPWSASLINKLRGSATDSSRPKIQRRSRQILGLLGVTVTTPAPAQDKQSDKALESSKTDASVQEPQTETNEASSVRPAGDIRPSSKPEAPAAPSSGSPSQTTSDSATGQQADTQGDTNTPSSDANTASKNSAPEEVSAEEPSQSSDDNAEETTAEEEVPPTPSDSGYNSNPEYEPEPEFGKNARDAILGDTPSY
ncbi:cell surface glycoprotein 1, putative [gamma proteobacterium HTCC5015]|nr:cell surface glycoprotein 1, putative [gamma proteobacterium HTCC5015]